MADQKGQFVVSDGQNINVFERCAVIKGCQQGGFGGYRVRGWMNEWRSPKWLKAKVDRTLNG